MLFYEVHLQGVPAMGNTPLWVLACRSGLWYVNNISARQLHAATHIGTMAASQAAGCSDWWHCLPLTPQQEQQVLPCHRTSAASH